MTARLPEIIDDYHLLHLLGHGGMGEVYLAEDIRTQKRVALKTLLSRSPGGTYRFQREFRSIARLKHPHVVEVFSYGLIDQNPYFTMEYIEGCTLKEHMRDWELSFRKNDIRATQRLVKTCKIMSQICSALYYIHTHSLIHRDLKPANIMVTQDGIVKLMDFGLAREIDTSLALTKTGAVIGTVAYMSPEQCKGARLDPRSDLYSLGVLLYEMVTGQKPFIGDRPMDVLFKHIEESPAPPSFVNPNVPPEIESIILRLLEKDPHLRFPNAQDLKRRWDEYLSYLTGETLASDIADSFGEMKREEPHWEPRFVGRSLEIERVESALKSEGTDCRHVVLIDGDAGIGKSRLIEEIAQKEKLNGKKVFLARCFPGENLPFRAFSDVMDAISAHLWRSDSNDQLRILGDDGKILARAFPGFGNLVSVQGQPEPDSLSSVEDRQRLFTSVDHLLIRISESQPIILVLDNLQWADQDAVDLLRFVIKAREASHDAQIRFVCIFRTEDTSANGPLTDLLADLNDSKSVCRVTVGALDLAGIGMMLQSILASEQPMPQFAGWLYEMTGGNPFFLEEIVVSLLENKTLFRKRSKWNLEIGNNQTILADSPAIQFGNLTVPRGIHDVISRRIDSIGDSPKKVLEWAAVAGRRFQFDLLRKMAVDSTEELFDCLDELLHLGIINERRGVDDEYFEFDHALMQEVVYDRLSSLRRRVYHRHLAEYFESFESAKRDQDQLAWHWFASDRPFRAPPYLFKSGESAYQRYATAHAIRLYTQAIDVLMSEKYAESGESATELLLNCLNRRGDVYEETGHASLAQTDYETALSQAIACGDRFNEGRAYNKLAMPAWTRGQFQRAIEYTENSMKIWQELGHTAPYSTCLINLGVQHWKLGRYTCALDYYKQALELSKTLKNKKIQAWTQMNIGLVLLSLGRERQSVSFFQECLEVYRKMQSKQDIIRVKANLGWAFFMAGDIETADVTLSDAIRMADSIDFPAARAILLSNMGEMARSRGSVESAIQMHEESLRLSTDIEDQLLVADNLGRLGLDAMLLGKYATGLSQIGKALEAFSSPEALDYEIPYRIVLSSKLMELGFIDQMKQHLNILDERMKSVTNPKFAFSRDLVHFQYLVSNRKLWMINYQEAQEVETRLRKCVSSIETDDAQYEYRRAVATRMLLCGERKGAIDLLNMSLSRLSADYNRIHYIETLLDLMTMCMSEDAAAFIRLHDIVRSLLSEMRLEPFLSRLYLLELESFAFRGMNRDAMTTGLSLLRTVKEQADGFKEPDRTIFLGSGMRRKLIFAMMRLFVDAGDEAGMRQLALEMNLIRESK